MANTKVAKEFYEVSKLSKYDFEPYWPDKKLKICVTGAGGFIASHLAKRLKSEGHYIIGCDWKRNEHMPVRGPSDLILDCCSPCESASLQLNQPLKLRSVPLQEEMFCDEFHLVDLRVYDNCKKVITGCEHVFNLAADMGGMGFIQSNHSVIMYNNTMISFNMLEAARVLEVKRYDC